MVIWVLSLEITGLLLLPSSVQNAKVELRMAVNIIGSSVNGVGMIIVSGGNPLLTGMAAPLFFGINQDRSFGSASAFRCHKSRSHNFHGRANLFLHERVL